MSRVAVETIEKTTVEAAWPSFSIVIPTYQRREVVCSAVRALAETDYPGDRELIVVVDGSTDGTAASLNDIRCPFHIRIIEQPNRGAARARNRGAAEASNDIILFLDDDMIADSNLLHEHAEIYRTGADAVVGDTWLDPASPPGFLSDSIRAWIDASRIDAALTPFDIWTGQLSVRRAVFEELGGFDEAFTSDGAFANEDADFGVELLARFNVRHHPAAISRQRYVVGPRELMDRAPLWASGDIRFVRKHPHLCRDLFKARGSTQRRTRFLFGPLARVNLIAAALRHVGVWGADIALRSPFRSSRTLARIFDGARSVAYWNELRRRGWFPASERVLVLCYHSIAGSSQHPADRFTVTAEALARQLDQLSARGFEFISPALFEAYLLHDAPMPRRAVLLTFDDGYADLMVTARDILKPRGIEAVAFVLTRPTSDHNDWDKGAGLPKRQLLAASQIQALAQLGIEIASHGRTHRELPSMPLAERTNEIDGSFNDLAELGLKPRFFAYPYGEVSSDSIEAVAGSHFVAAFGADAGWVNRRSQRFNLPRTVVTARDRGWRFRLKTGAPRLYNWVANPADQPRYLLRRLAGFISGPK
jgi:glycosyltransferase involved in cell wall biosynthesis/peptidoglycan/xylan/chitin deacetylase (PgdA/CDA1 family)